MNNSIEIKTQKDLDDHIKWHSNEVDKFYDAKEKLLDNCHETLTQQEIDSLNYLDQLQENIKTDSYPLELENGKITMYVNHEGSCMSNIQYCPWCGIHFMISAEKS
jgi:hypothetical protein